MYSNIPKELALRSVLGRWDSICKNTSITILEFKRAISIILNSTFFKFNNDIYEQIFDLPMGSPLSPILADVVIQDLENDIFNTLTTHIPFYFRYVDDIVFAAPNNLITSILDSFNAYHEHVKFTVDFGDDTGINFLDVKRLIDSGRIVFDIYNIRSLQTRVSQFFSNHPILHKRSVVIGLLDRILFLSHPKFHNINISSLIITLHRNGYPLQFLFATTNNRIKTLSVKKNFNFIKEHNVNSYADTSTINKKFFTIPYLKRTSEKFKLTLHKFHFDLVYKPMNSMNRFIKTGKDKIKKEELSNVVY